MDSRKKYAKTTLIHVELRVLLRFKYAQCGANDMNKYYWERILLKKNAKIDGLSKISMLRKGLHRRQTFKLIKLLIKVVGQYSLLKLMKRGNNKYCQIFNAKQGVCKKLSLTIRQIVFKNVCLVID